jgi:hypothetical protein
MSSVEGPCGSEPLILAVRLKAPCGALRGADQLAHRHLRGNGLDRLADHVGVLVEQHLPDDLLDRQPVGTGHAAPPFVEP